MAFQASSAPRTTIVRVLKFERVRELGKRVALLLPRAPTRHSQRIRVVIQTRETVLGETSGPSSPKRNARKRALRRKHANSSRSKRRGDAPRLRVVNASKIV